MLTLINAALLAFLWTNKRIERQFDRVLYRVYRVGEDHRARQEA